MSKWPAFVLVSLTVLNLSPSPAEAKVCATKRKPAVKSAGKKSTTVSAKSSVVIREQSAVLQPEGDEVELNMPAGALYTTSDDVG